MPGRILEDILTKAVEFNTALVTEVHINDSDKESGQKIETNSSQVVEIKPFNSNLPTLSRRLEARPLFRGISDSITRGDIVLFTQIAKKVYYIGPLNTKNDPMESPYNKYSSTMEGRGAVDRSQIDESGYGKVYPSERAVKKLSKKRNNDLDFLEPQYYRFSKHSDLLIEGRHGNSIRLGSNAIFPNLILSNNNEADVENISIGSQISFLSNGTISQNFSTLNSGFRLSVDIPFEVAEQTEQEPPHNFRVNKGSGVEPFNVFDYDYGFEDGSDDENDEYNQILFTSDRITFNVRSETKGDFTVSSKRNISFGAGENVIINNPGYSLINSDNIYLGIESKSKKEPLVLGDELRKLLEDMAKILKNAHALVQGVPIPLVDKAGAFLNLPTTKGATLENNTLSISEILDSLKERTTSKTNADGQEITIHDVGNTKFLSQHHFIETNRS
tara:strand:+ start:182 stop:1516 length:1335 start_codon:yes stop_codon:yes gene_type:complete